jgi:Flp pilus assembly pilin Flp
VIATFKKYLADCSGSNAIEYAVIASAMGLALIPILPAISSAVEGKYTSLLPGFGN